MKQSKYAINLTKVPVRSYIWNDQTCDAAHHRRHIAGSKIGQRAPTRIALCLQHHRQNEASYKGKLSTYHSLIVDSPQGVSTNGIRPGAGISRSYFTFHYIPNHVVSLDLYHNYFRDVPTALTPIVGTGLADKLLFQGINGGVRVKPIRQFTLYSTVGTSAKTGDLHRSLNQMYGLTWDEIPHTGIRADFHYSKFDSNFAEGNYRMLSLSRQLTNRMYWNVQAGTQHVEALTG